MSGGGEHEIPKVIVYQALNFFGLMGLIYFLTRKKIQTFFATRHERLTAAISEAKRFRQEAEAKIREYSENIQKLEREGDQMLSQMRKEGEDAKKRLQKEAEELAVALEREAQKTAQIETEKARAELYDEVLTQGLDGARRILSQTIAENDQKRLQKEFVEKIEAVQ